MIRWCGFLGTGMIISQKYFHRPHYAALVKYRYVWPMGIFMFKDTAASWGYNMIGVFNSFSSGVHWWKGFLFWLLNEYGLKVKNWIRRWLLLFLMLSLSSPCVFCSFFLIYLWKIMYGGCLCLEPILEIVCTIDEQFPAPFVLNEWCATGIIRFHPILKVSVLLPRWPAEGVELGIK